MYLGPFQRPVGERGHTGALTSSWLHRQAADWTELHRNKEPAMENRSTTSAELHRHESSVFVFDSDGRRRSPHNPQHKQNCWEIKCQTGREINVLIVCLTGRHVSEVTSGPETLTGTSTGLFVEGMELLKRPQVTFLIDFHLSVFLFS